MLYRKVYIKKDGFPKEDGRYIVGFDITYDEDANITPPQDCSFMADYNKQYSFHEEMTDCSGIEWWLETVKEPTEEQISEKAKKDLKYQHHLVREHHDAEFRLGFCWGYKQALKDLKGE